MSCLHCLRVAKKKEIIKVVKLDLKLTPRIKRDHATASVTAEKVLGAERKPKGKVVSRSQTHPTASEGKGLVN